MSWYVLIAALSVLNFLVSVVAVCLYLYLHGRGPPEE